MAPEANAGKDQTVTLGDTVTLSAADSDQKNGDALSYQWTITGAPSGSVAQLSDPHAKNPTFTPDKIGDYLFELLVDNDYHKSEPAIVKIHCISSGTSIPNQFATDPFETVFLYDLDAKENWRDTTNVNFSLVYTLENKGDATVSAGVMVYGLDANGVEIYSYEIKAGLDPGEKRISTLSVGEALTIDEYDSITKWEADDITVYE